MKKRRNTESAQRVADNLNRIYYSKRKALGLTQEKIAQSMGFKTQGAVSLYLRGVNPLGLEAGLKFAKLLKVQPSEINPEWIDYDDDEPLTPEQREIWEQIKDMDQEQLAYIKAQLDLALPLLSKSKEK